jgi:dolichol-phosphate mannosyltransferase
VSGLREAEADVYVVMDSDLQDPPELLPDLLAAWAEGWEVVYCVRKNRKEGPLLKAAYAIYYRLLARMSYLRIPLDSGDFCLMDRKVVHELRRMGEHNPFVRGMRAWVGFRQRALEYDRSERAGGESKYPLHKLFALAYDGLISFSFLPLRSAMHVGYLVAAVSFLAMCYIVCLKVFWGISLSGWASLASIMLFLGGVQLLTLGFIGEYLARVFDEVKARPLYVVKERKG